MFRVIVSVGSAFACALVVFGCSGDDAPTRPAVDAGGRDGAAATDSGTRADGAPQDAPEPPPDDGGGTDRDAVADTGSPPGDAGDCVDDAREEDDVLATAMAGMPVYGTRPVVLSGLVSCPGDDDLIFAYADCCTVAGAVVTYDPAQGELGVDLLDETGAPLTADVISRSPGNISLLRSGYGGNFFVQVRGMSGTRVDYDAEVHAMVYVK